MAFLPYLNYICSFFNQINIFNTGGQLPILVNYDQFLIFFHWGEEVSRGLLNNVRRRECHLIHHGKSLDSPGGKQSSLSLLSYLEQIKYSVFPCWDCGILSCHTNWKISRNSHNSELTGWHSETLYPTFLLYLTKYFHH